MSLSRRDLPTFPSTFQFGVATADHQCEAYLPQFEDIRDVWERVRNLTPRGQATDFWQRYPEDIALAQQLGCRLFRFSIAWSRVEPRPGEWNTDALDHYRRLVQAVRAVGMQPLVTLHHFTWPVHLEQRGGLLADDFPQRFAEYAHRVATHLGLDAGQWITFNEPTMLLFGYIKPWWEPNYFNPPGLPEGSSVDAQIEAVGKFIPNIFRAHTLGRQAILAVNPAAQVGANPLVIGFPAWLQRCMDWNASRLRGPRDLYAQGRRFAERGRVEPGEVDVLIAALTETQERAEQVAFSQPYLVVGQRLVVSDTSPLTDLTAFEGQTVAVVAGTTAEANMTRWFPQARAYLVDSYAAGLDALDLGQADAMLADDFILQSIVALRPDDYRFVGDRLSEDTYAAAVTLGNTELLDAVDLALRSFKATHRGGEGSRGLGAAVMTIPPPTARSLAELYSSQTPPTPPLAGLALRRIQQRGYLRVGVRDDIPGVAYRDPATGELTGLEIDLARHIATHLLGDPTRVRFQVTSPTRRIPLLRTVLDRLDPWLKQYSIVSTLLTSNWWHLGMAGHLAEFLCPPECVGQQDFVGFDYYWGINTLRLDRIRQLFGAAAGRFKTAPVWSGALYDMLHYHARLFPNQPIIIIENGCVESADGVTRATYLQTHLHEVARAVRDGINVRGYIGWAITSNREWGHAFGPDTDFGLFHIALDDDPGLKRQPTEAAEIYRRIIQGVQGLGTW